MYIPQDAFEKVRYGELFNSLDNTSKRNVRKLGRQFRRYLKTDVADYDRAEYEASQQQRRNAAIEAKFTSKLPIQTSPAITEDKILAQEEAMNQRLQDLQMQDLDNRIANASFNDAFGMARKAGLKTFKWRGGVYGTELAKPQTSKPKVDELPKVDESPKVASTYKSDPLIRNMEIAQQRERYERRKQDKKEFYNALLKGNFKSIDGWETEKIKIPATSVSTNDYNIYYYNAPSGWAVYAFDPAANSIRRIKADGDKKPKATGWQGYTRTHSFAEGSKWIPIEAFLEWNRLHAHNYTDYLTYLKAMENADYSKFLPNQMNLPNDYWRFPYYHINKPVKKEGGVIESPDTKSSKQSASQNPKHAGFDFSVRTLPLTSGYSIVTHQIYPRYEVTDDFGEKHPYYRDFGGNVGRVIYNRPNGADTVYYDTPNDYIAYPNGYLSIGEATDQEKSKKNFYRYVNWVDKISDKESEAAYKRAILGHKKGGIMQYFQQGGVTPQRDVKSQVMALVKAAMQGDQKATDTVNKIMEAAKAGDQQAIQIAQIMEQVIKELQGQATAAKWGAKLDYIKSLKFAKGGKTCPECEKKVEIKACGGKKAKKRYFGGLI